MATFGHIVYAVLDLLKESSDDAYYTEEHIIFFAKKIRATLLERKYKGSRNSSFSIVSEENKQQICLQLQPVDLLPGTCDGKWLVSTKQIPQLMSGFDAVTCTGHDLLPTNVTFISPQRMQYVGYNKWLKNIVYACRGIDGRLYLKGNNPQFMYLENVGLTGVFSDPEAAARLSHEACTTGVCDLLNQEFPLESGLVASLVEMVTQELIGSRYAPEDKENNAKDDLGELGVSNGRSAKPVENTNYNSRARHQEEE